MDLWAMQMSSFAAGEETRGSLGAADRRTPVFCPKPRRIGPLPAADPVRPLRCQADLFGSKAGAELLDLFSLKEEAAASPPFFCGSPPVRVSNPVVHDARFGQDWPPAPVDFLPAVIPPGATPPPPQMSPRKGCARAKFGLEPAIVRIEGFDCRRLDRDRRSRSITAVA